MYTQILTLTFLFVGVIDLSQFEVKNIEKMSKPSPNIKTFVFMDIETTGLPFQENNTTKITELCLLAVETDHINFGIIPRVQNMLNLCFDPKKPINPFVSSKTGLSNQLLESQSDFNSWTFQTVSGFLQNLPKPACLVAHNGERFDFPIFKAELIKLGMDLPPDVLCLDSLIAFKALCNKENIDVRNKQNGSSQGSMHPPKRRKFW